ncbi:hypothetical protein VPNG_04403 [Cytospora leucostoma]|uniref:Uncharacterized protein n=1 Tax=Cytospora leucostoma TaxID=1230097 RepID=A0A423XBZ7_9PEZI|nr:hypothetical protein VPNG_04403 [Cytospora leucostoma]
MSPQNPNNATGNTIPGNDSGYGPADPPSWTIGALVSSTSHVGMMSLIGLNSQPHTQLPEPDNTSGTDRNILGRSPQQ